MKRFQRICNTLVVLFAAFIIGGCKASGTAEQVLSSIEFIEIPAGSFFMGADLDPKYIAAGPEEKWRSVFIQDEFPSRQVSISKGFAISKTEITNVQYEAFDPGHRSWRGNFAGLSTEDHEAVVYVSWEDAMAFTRWLSDNDDQFDYRLPTEAEWEYAARAGTRTPFSNGLSGDIYSLNPMDENQMQDKNYQWPYPFTWSNGCRSWVKWLPENCIGVEDVYPNKHDIQDADLTVGQTAPNAFGIYDMMGNVEEWVLDWYGLYDPADTVDPAGPAKGDFKVARGGSHNNHIQHMRSANRMSSAINDKHYMLGFRVVRVPKGEQLPSPSREQPLRPWAEQILQEPYDWEAPKVDPVFSVYSLYELVSQNEDGSHYGTDEQMKQFGFDPGSGVPILTGPLYTHNHSPTITWCENGDMLVSWFSGESEIGPELTLLACRGVRQTDGSLKWTPPSEILKAADRNMHSSNLLNNGLSIKNGSREEFVIHQMASIGVAGRWDKLALGYRRSADNGASWTPVRMVLELDHALNDGASMQGNMFQHSDGSLIFVTDDESDSLFNTGSLVVSEDGGESWTRRGHSSNTPGEQRIAGLHAAVIEIEDRNGDGETELLAIARDKGIYFGGRAPQSISYDGGNTWERSPTIFPSISSGKRFSMIRLRNSAGVEGYQGTVPILFVGFASNGFKARSGEGEIGEIEGMFAAVSFDEGRTWKAEHRRVLSDLKGEQVMELHTAPWQRSNMISRSTGQEGGYMIATQTPDGMIYLTDGKLVYQFNLQWIID